MEKIHHKRHRGFKFGNNMAGAYYIIPVTCKFEVSALFLADVVNHLMDIIVGEKLCWFLLRESHVRMLWYMLVVCILCDKFVVSIEGGKVDT